MRKFIILLMVLGLALMTTQALAIGLGPNELTNGNFGTGDLTGWSVLSGHGTFTVYSIYPFYAAGAQYHTEQELGIYQVIDESQFPGWLPNGTGKQWRADLAVGVSGVAGGELHLLYYPTNPGSAPALYESGDTFPGWVVLKDADYYSGTSSYTYSGTIEGFQPRWIAYVLELTVVQTSGSVLFGANDFEAQCVPLPPAVWLFGSGLLGLVGLRRKFAK